MLSRFTKRIPDPMIQIEIRYAWIGWAYTVELVKGGDEDYVQDLLQFPELVIAEHWCLTLVTESALQRQAWGPAGDLLLVGCNQP